MPVRRSTILVAAFAAFFAICGGAAWAAWSYAQQAQATAERLHQRDMAIHEALGDVRADVYLTGILVRDALLEDTPVPSEFEAPLRQIQDEMDASLSKLRAEVTGEEMESTLARLTGELASYSASTNTILGMKRRKDRKEALARRAGRRKDILALAERIETLASASSLEQRSLSEADASYFRVALAWIAALSFLLGVGVAGVAFFRIRFLEEQSAMAETKLRSLSGQLRNAQEHERKHLSRELHDEVGQVLTGLRMELAAISRSQAGWSAESVAALERAKKNVEHTLSMVRNIAMLLRPSMLDDLGLTPALNWLGREMQRSSGIEVRKEIDPAVDQLPDSHRTCLFRTVQEALTNVSRHSGARSVELRVTRQGNAVHVRVADDGRGFDAALAKGKGLGLLGMEERVRELGGQLKISTAEGHGTTLDIVLPEPETLEGVHIETIDVSDDRRRSRHREDRIKTAV